MTVNDPLQGATRALLSALVDASGLSIAEFARTVVARDERTVRRWLGGTMLIPDSVGDWLGKIEISVNSRTITVRVQR